jgi:serine/threonine-protein kinase
VPGDDPHVADLAAAILDGTPIDWPAVEAGSDDEQRRLLEELRLLCTVAGVHRDLPPPRDAAGAASHDRYWGRLRLIERVGGGAFGEVYRAWDPRLHREVALKLIAAGEDADGDRTASIIREGRLLARVRHPGVVTIYDAEHSGAHVGLCMEFVEGPTLEQRIRQEGAFDAARTVEIGLQLCDALAAVHAAGVLHRDVKAANVVVKDDGRVVLMDFGAGTHLDESSTSDRTGTPLYVAPEVLDGHDATIRSDIYSLGVLLHRMLTGSYPVPARSLAELRRAHADRSHRTPDTARASGLTAILERATDPSPGRRYESASRLAADLRALRRGTPARVRSLALVTVALVLLAITAGWWLATGPLNSSGATGAGIPSGQRTLASGDPVRIAVLPFVVTGETSGGDSPWQGMTSDLIARLQTFENVRVISSASVLSIDSQRLPLRDIASRLRVSAIVSGRVVRSGDTLAVDVTLAGVPGERTLWSRHYRYPAAGLMHLQQAIVQDLAGTLRLRRDAGPQRWPTRDPQAYALYVRGRVALDGITPHGVRLALQLFEQAVALDPDYAQAYAGLALVYMQMNPAIPNVTGEQSLQRAGEAAARALSLDESLPDGHVAAAAVKSAHADWAGAEREYKRAIQLGPSDVQARQQYAHWLSLLGRFDEALEQAHMAESLDPLSARAIMSVASVLRFARRFDEAMSQARKALALDPSHVTAFLNLGHDYQGLGQLDKAIDAFQRVGRPSGNLGHVYALAGRTREARALIAQFERQYAATGLGAGDIAQIYSGLGERDQAFLWLDRMDQYQAGWPTTFRVAAVWDPLRSDPRFATLLKKHGLAE